MQFGEASAPVLRGQLQVGSAGTAETLALMRQLVEQGKGDLTVIEAARRIVEAAGVAGHDFAGELRALFAFVRDQVRYVRDPAGIELLQAPAYTLQHKQGDCDDRAILLASLLAAIGHPAQLAFRAIGTNPFSRDRYSHVYVVATFNGKRVPLDPTFPKTPLGWEYPTPSASMGLAL